MKRLVFFAPLALFVLVAVYFAFGLGRDPSYVPSMLIDRPVPALDLPGIDERGGLTSDRFKGQVSMLNVFGSWCVACKIEHPFLMELAAREATPIYGLNWKDPPDAGAAWLRRFGDPYAAVGVDLDGRAAIDLGVTGAPETFVIDKAGRVRHKHVGPITPEIWRTVLAPMIAELENAQEGNASLAADAP